MLAGLVLLLGAVYLGRDQIHEFVDFFIAMVESYGAYGYVAYAVVYFLLVWATHGAAAAAAASFVQQSC